MARSIHEDQSGTWVRRGTTVSRLRPLMEAWVARSSDYCRCHGWEDNGWWYNERASLSILAAAAWSLKGWCALEEYATTKQGVVPPGNADAGKVKPGRCDLWMGRNTGYSVEAKQVWQSIGSRASGKNPDLWNQYDAAWNDAGNLTCDEADVRLAALFVSPYLPVSDIRRESGRSGRVGTVAIQSAALEWLSAADLRSDPRVHGVAWYFPKKCGEFISKSGKNAFPGAVLILGERKRANRRA